MERIGLECCREVTRNGGVMFGFCCVCMAWIGTNLWKVHASDVCYRWCRCTEIVRWKFENELNL